MDIERYRLRLKIRKGISRATRHFIEDILGTNVEDSDMEIEEVYTTFVDAPQMAHTMGWSHPDPDQWTEEQRQIALKLAMAEMLMEEADMSVEVFYPWKAYQVFPGEVSEKPEGEEKYPWKEVGKGRTRRQAIAALDEYVKQYIKQWGASRITVTVHPEDEVDWYMDPEEHPWFQTGDRFADIASIAFVEPTEQGKQAGAVEFCLLLVKER